LITRLQRAGFISTGQTIRHHKNNFTTDRKDAHRYENPFIRVHLWLKKLNLTRPRTRLQWTGFMSTPY